LRDLESGKETALTATPENEIAPRISSGGSKVAYGVLNPGQSLQYVMSIAAGGAPGVAEKIYGDCGRPDDWSPDLRKILFSIANPQGPDHPSRLPLLDLPSGEKVNLVQPPQHQLGGDHLSPDGQWASFVET